MQAVGYVRVSTEEQARDRVSLSAQRAKLEAYGLVKDWTLLKVIRDEGYSAKHLKRPGLEELLALVTSRQVDAVLVYKLDRLTHSVADLDKLIKLFDRHQVALVSLEESLDATTATGRLMMNLLASVSQWEREVIGERTRDALQRLKAQGKRYCHTVHADAEAIALMHQLRAQGYPYARIAEHLNQAGIPTAQGQPWQAMVVWGIVRRTQPKQERGIA
jgi:DNA invertase Pin-like site-specific DNA recombinase